MSVQRMKAPAKRAVMRDKWVLGYTARATQQGSWNIVFVPESKKEDLVDMKPVPEAKLYRIEEYTETRAIVAARKLLKAELALALPEAERGAA